MPGIIKAATVAIPFNVVLNALCSISSPSQIAIQFQSPKSSVITSKALK
jgi:hypothetical protein